MPVVAAVVATAATVASIGYGVYQSKKQEQIAGQQKANVIKWGAQEVKEIRRVGQVQREEYVEAAQRFKERQAAQAGATGFKRESGSIQQIFTRTETKIRRDLEELRAGEEAAIKRVESQVEAGVLGAEAAQFEARGAAVQTLLGGLADIGSLVGGFKFQRKPSTSQYGYGGGYYGAGSTGPAWTPAMYGGAM